ncbi:hypothetical protein BKA81DRAFT_230427 [Phyllosticta paracitricarpa]
MAKAQPLAVYGHDGQEPRTIWGTTVPLRDMSKPQETLTFSRSFLLPYNLPTHNPPTTSHTPSSSLYIYKLLPLLIQIQIHNGLPQQVHPAAEHERKSSGGFLDKLTGREEQHHESPEVENKRYHEEAEHEKHSFLDRITGKAEREEEERRRREEEEKNKGFFDKMGDKLNTAAGGGRESEKNEDKLDKVLFIVFLVRMSIFFLLTAVIAGIDFVQEHIMKQGTQSDESAWEQKKDKMIADAIRGGYKSTTGHEFFLKEKEKEEKEKEEKEKEDKKHFWE